MKINFICFLSEFHQKINDDSKERLKIETLEREQQMQIFRVAMPGVKSKTPLITAASASSKTPATPSVVARPDTPLKLENKTELILRRPETPSLRLQHLDYH